MIHKLLIRCTAVSMAILMALSPVSVSTAALLKTGSRGVQVKTVQTNLKELGYFTYRTTGYYGSITAKAVKSFQRANGLVDDGIVGNRTYLALQRNLLQYEKKPILKAAADSKLQSLTGSAVAFGMDNISPQYSGALDWFKKVRYIWDRGEDATVTDVATGKSFQVKRTYGTNHADVEPLTKQDTQIIKEIWGDFSWERRAVMVQLGAYTIAASMTAMPHAGLDSAAAGRYVSGRSKGYGYGINLDAVKGNGCNGVMDIHFKNSRTHSTNVMQTSQQNMVNKSATYIKSLIISLYAK